MDGWMDNEKRMMVEGERELRRVSMTRLGCLVAYPKSGHILKVRQNTRHPSQSPNFCVPAQRQPILKASLRFCLLYSVHGAKLRSQTIINVPTLPCSALVNAKSGEGTISTSNQSRSANIGHSLDDVPVFTQAYLVICGCHQVYV